jgi:hypothetical protein
MGAPMNQQGMMAPGMGMGMAGGMPGKGGMPQQQALPLAMWASMTQRPAPGYGIGGMVNQMPIMPTPLNPMAPNPMMYAGGTPGFNFRGPALSEPGGMMAQPGGMNGNLYAGGSPGFSFRGPALGSSTIGPKEEIMAMR